MVFFSKLNVREVLNYLPDPIIIADSLGNIRFCNQSFANLLKYTIDEIAGRNVINFLLDDSIFEECMTELKNNANYSDQTTVFIDKNGQHIYTTKNVRLIKIDDEACLFVNIRDVSNIDKLNYELNSSKRELEEKSKQLVCMLDDHKKQIEEKQLQLDEIVNIIDEIIWYIDDKSMKVKYVSNAIETIFGEKKESFLQDLQAKSEHK